MGPDDWAKLLAETLPVKQIYEDGLQPGMKQVGKALETTIGFANTLLFPVEWINERVRIALRTNLERYRRKMEEIPEEKVIEVTPDLGVPLLQKLSYVTDETLAELFSELLVSSSVDDRVYSAHPSFINVISNLSPDEAILLTEIALDDDIPFIVIKYRTQYPLPETFDERLTGLEARCKLRYPQNIQVYLQNFVGLGILICHDDRILSDEKYNILTALYKDRLAKELDDCTAGDYYTGLELDRGFYRTTDYGRLFYMACILRPKDELTTKKSRTSYRQRGTL